VTEKVLEIVAEKTGYPREMLDLDLDLEADLGVDTVKQAEMFAAIRETYNIPRDDSIKLRDFPTLGHVIRFARERRPDLAIAATPMAAPPAVPAAADSVQEMVLGIVAEKTGYPKEMLDLDLDLEADLGIDTVKQAEMFAAIRQAYDIPRDDSIKLRDFPTLGHVIRFARERRPAVVEAAAANEETPAAPAVASPAPGRSKLAGLEAADRVPRRVPMPRLRPALELTKPTGVTLGAGCRVAIMPDLGGVSVTLAERLQAMGVEVISIEQAMAAGDVHGVYWLPALDPEGSLTDMDPDALQAAIQVRIKSLYATMRALYEKVAGRGTFLVSATRLGGQHGYDPAGAVAPLGGAVTGFTKAYKRERPEAVVKAVDFEPECNPQEIAEMLIAETLRDPGAVEIGRKRGLRWTIGLEEQPAADGHPGLTLDQNTVFVITGAAGSIVSAITADLAAASGGIFYLLDLAPEPDPANPDLARFVNDRDGLKKDLFARIQASGKKATPALVEKELANLERSHAAWTAIEAVRSAGGTAYYAKVNLTDAWAVSQVIRQVRERHGSIDVLLHAAGMERSHFLPDKNTDEFDLVFDVKTQGWFNLLCAIGDMPLGATVAFSSIAGRFGNGGQTDYSSANDLLCKIASNFRTTRPSTRAIVIDWTAWGGIGMASRGSIPKMMEMAGIDMLAPEAGIPVIRRELTAGAKRGEVVIAERLGILVQEPDPDGGLDASALSPLGPMSGRVAGFSLNDGLTIETTLDPAVQPFLHDHQIDGTPVLPGVMGVEGFAESALLLLPGWHVQSVEEVNYLAPFKFYRNEPRTLTIQARLRPEGDEVVAECRLTGVRTLPNQPEPQVTTHFTARVRLSPRAPECAPVAGPGAATEALVKAADIYKVYFHGPAYQVLEQAWMDGERLVGQMAGNLPDNHHPAALPLVMSPRLIELCFQAAGLWEMGVHGKMGLPLHIDRVCCLPQAGATTERLYAVVTPEAGGGSFQVDVVDAAGNRFVRMSGYRMVEVPYGVDIEPLKALHAVVA
jgi:NAD(P)-dependent dehydrogenase (short-subunit alcohol dehydrogenase family)/acyl carrier protein